MFAILSAMVITHHKGECFKVVSGDTTLVFGPASKESKNLKPVNFGADVAFVSLNHPDMNGAADAARGGREPIVLEGPGEYEVGAMFATGLPSISLYDKVESINTIYEVQFDNLTLVYLGALGNAKLSSEVLEKIEDVDVLLTPIGGGGVLSPNEAHKLSALLEARIVIPMHYEGMGDKGALKMFLKEVGEGDIQPIDKLTIKQKDVADKNGEVIVLSA